MKIEIILPCLDPLNFICGSFEEWCTLVKNSHLMHNTEAESQISGEAKELR